MEQNKNELDKLELNKMNEEPDDEEPEFEPITQSNKTEPQAPEFFEIEYRDIKLRIGSCNFSAINLGNFCLEIINHLKNENGNKPDYV